MRLPHPNTAGDFQPLAAGTHTAICYRVIDLGTQASTYQGKTTQKHKVMLSWETPDELMEDGRPFTVSKRYTWTMHAKGILRKDLESWRGAPFQDSDFGPTGFDIKNLLGKPCTVVVSHSPGDGDKVYTNVDGVGPKMKNVPTPRQHNGNVFLSLDPLEFDEATFQLLPDRIRDIISKSPEFEALSSPGGTTRDYADYKSGNRPLVDDDIPF
jgi:hypothetical protein